MVDKLRIGLLFGGQSAEHEVSCRSAWNVAAEMDTDKYEVVPIGITLDGRWVLPDSGSPTSATSFEASGPDLRFLTGTRPWQLATDKQVDLDVFFPLIHGPGGEDGTVQGLLELAGYPYVGSGVLASAMGMDKEKMKVAFAAAGLPMGAYVCVQERTWRTDRKGVLEMVGLLGLPAFTKPANLGSSIGISRCTTVEELGAGIDLAFNYDRKVIVEEAISGREIECAIIGNETPEASVCGEVLPGREFYDYEAKYLDESSRTLVPAPIPEPVADLIRSYSLRAFKAIDAAGMARVDCFYAEGGRGVLVNEINTIPGFTPISMYPQLWEASGLSYRDLIDRLIELALKPPRT